MSTDSVNGGGAFNPQSSAQGNLTAQGDGKEPDQSQLAQAIKKSSQSMSALIEQLKQDPFLRDVVNMSRMREDQLTILKDQETIRDRLTALDALKTDLDDLRDKQDEVLTRQEAILGQLEQMARAKKHVQHLTRAATLLMSVTAGVAAWQWYPW